VRSYIFSWGFLIAGVLGAIGAVLAFDFDPARIGMYYLMPFYGVCIAMQYLWPEKPNRFEKGEVITDLLNNAGMFLMTGLNNFLIHALIAATGAGLLFHFGVLDAAYAARNLPFAAQVILAWLTFDLMFYITHRMAHEVDFFWRLHSVHHCAHRLSVLNASRAHPLDLLWRRVVPSFVVFQTGISPEAFLMSGAIGSVLATITHMNVNFRFGVLNYVIGTNEIHRWHHSNRIEEAKNYSIVMLWDHLFGTFVYHPPRRGPEQMGLFNEKHYPVHGYWGQLWIPLRWNRMKARQLLHEQTTMPAADFNEVLRPPTSAEVKPATV